MQSERAAWLVEGGTRPEAVRHALALVRARLEGHGPALAPAGPRVSLARSAVDAPDATAVSRPVPAGTAVVLATSGSSGTPRLVALGADALLAAADACHERVGGPGRWLLALPIHHVAGFQVLVRSVVAGAGEPVVLDTSRGFDAAALPAAVAELGTARPRALGAVGPRDTPRYTSLVPTQLVRCLAHPPAAAALAGLDAVLVGGAALPRSLRERAETAGIRVVETYGSTETGGGCVYDGVPLPGVDVAVPGGRIEVSGPVLASGYVDDVGALVPHDRHGVFVHRDARLWVRMPDLGAVDDDGRLTVHGRADDAVVTGGVKVHPASVEEVLQELDGVAEAAVVGLPDPEWGASVTALVVLAPGGREPSLDAVREAVGRRLGRAHAPRSIAVVDALPRLGPGKVDRAGATRLATAILAGPTAEPDITADRPPSS